MKILCRKNAMPLADLADPTNVVCTCNDSECTSRANAMAAVHAELRERIAADTHAPWQQRTFSQDHYNIILKATIAEIEKLGTFKGGEYAGDGDRLANFRRNAINLGLLPEQVWAVYAGKHWDAVMQYIKDLGTGKERKRLESIEGRMDDLLVYLILAKCMLKEREQG